MKGKVYLVGAGPGDYRLFTIGARECLEKADVVVYDRLADSSALRWAPADAEMIYVGKASSRHTMKQEDINVLLADKAAEGKTVVRLKGGDPFVFGRGGEEALVLRERGIPFEVLPGVTSAISVPAYAGIPVTHRAVATSFAVVTGHEDPTKPESGMNWKGLATAVDTLVFLMGIANLPLITAKLIDNGRPKETPCAVIRWGTRAEQETLTTTLENAAADVERAGIKPPAIFVVGEVVKLREKLRWFDNLSLRPLFGRRILVTRARAQASSLVRELEALGAACHEVPSIEIKDPTDDYAAIDAAIDHVESYHWLIFTSVNGVERFFDRLYRAGKDARALGYAKIASIGSATARSLVAHGVHADLIPQEFRAEGILEAISGKLPPHAKILLPRAEEAREVLPESLREKGATVDVVAAYRTVKVAYTEKERQQLADDLTNGVYDYVTFTSSSTVRNLAEILGNVSPLAGAKTAAIGPVTADTMEKYAITPTVTAEKYTIKGLVAAIVENAQQG